MLIPYNIMTHISDSATAVKILAIAAHIFYLFLVLVLNVVVP